MAESGTAIKSQTSFQPWDKLPSSTDYRRTRTRLKRLIQKDPCEKHFLELAELEYRSRHFAEAEVAVKEALKKAPNSMKGWLLQAKIFEGTDRIEEAREVYTRLLAQHPDCSILYREYARFLFDVGDSSNKSESLLLQGLALNPKDVLAHALLAEVYVHTGRVKQALLHIETAFFYYEEDTHFHQRCAKVYLQMGEYSEAIEQLRLALKADPRNKVVRAQFYQTLKSRKKGLHVFPMLSIMWRRVWS